MDGWGEGWEAMKEGWGTGRKGGGQEGRGGEGRDGITEGEGREDHLRRRRVG